MSGSVYIMSNKGMPDIYKIGMTRSGGKERAVSLDNTSVAYPFDCIAEWETETPLELERYIQSSFEPRRLRPSREFFRFSSSRNLIDDVELLVGSFVPKKKSSPANKDKVMPVWQPTAKQREWIEAQAEQNGGGVTQVVRDLINKAMRGKK